MTARLRRSIGAATIAVAGIVAIYLLRMDDAAGLLVDDAWYIVLAKGLASGEGYRLISSATTPILPVVPPGFPALLSLGFWIDPSFPDNVFWLKAISLLAVGGLAAACWLDFTRHRGVSPGQATLLVATATLTPAIVFLATSTVMAECVFAFAQVVTVILVERIRRHAFDDATSPVVAGVASAVVILVRTAGVAVAAAAIVYLALGRRWRQAAIYGGVVAVLMVPWQLYWAAHAPTDAERAAHGGTIVYLYNRLLTMTRLNDPTTGSLSLRDMVARAGANLFGIVARDFGGVVLPVAYRGSDESGEEVLSVGAPGRGSMGAAGATMAVSLLVSAMIVAGWIGSARERLAMPALVIAASIVVIVPVGAQTFRYVVPLTPYLLLFLWHGFRRQAVARIALMCVLGLHLLDHAQYIAHKRAGTADWIADARENDAIFSWMTANLGQPGAAAASNPGLVYLRTGMKTVASVDPTLNWERWRALGARYVVATLGESLPPAELNGRLLFRTDRRKFWVVELVGPR